MFDSSVQLVFISSCRDIWDCSSVALDDISLTLGDCGLAAGALPPYWVNELFIHVTIWPKASAFLFLRRQIIINFRIPHKVFWIGPEMKSCGFWLIFKLFQFYSRCGRSGLKTYDWISVAVALASVLPGHCDFEAGLCDYSQDKQDDGTDWERRRGPTPTSYTGPRGDHTTGLGKETCCQFHWTAQNQ